MNEHQSEFRNSMHLCRQMMQHLKYISIVAYGALSSNGKNLFVAHALGL